jgi:hypothetical protein
MSNTLEKIKLRGYWKVVIRPAEFLRERVAELLYLKEIIRKSSVELRGWDFPHISSNTDISVGMDWVGQEVDWSEHVETWRLYQSGQFAFYGGIYYDWQDQSIFERPSQSWTPGKHLGVVDTIFRLTEIYELAARLSMTEAGGDSLFIGTTLVGLSGRALRIDDPRRSGFSYPRTSAIQEFPYSVTLPREQLVSEARDQALKHADQLFTRFNWTAGVEFLKTMQESLFK